MTDRKTGWQDDGTYAPCPECEWKPPPDRLRMGIAIHFPGTTHYSLCPVTPRLSREAERRLSEDLREMDRCRRRAWATAQSYVIG